MKHVSSAPYRSRILHSIVTALVIGFWAAPTARGDLVVGDLENTFDTISSVNPGMGYAQRFDVTSGFGSVLMARLYLGNQDPVYPVTPLVEIRDASGAGGGPGLNVFGTFSVNPADIPVYVFGMNQFAAVTAAPQTTLSLGVGTYWLCIVNAGSIGSFQEGLSSINPLTQSGTSGAVINLNGIALSTDNGQSYGLPGFSGSALLMELYAQPIPEPSSTLLISVALLAGAFVKRKT